MADIFLSYKKEDRARAGSIVDALRKSGRSVWWDEGLTPRQAWDATIEREIGEAACVVVLWSPRSVASDWVRTEAHYAQDKSKLVPVLIEPCTRPLAFMLKQAVDLSGWRGSISHPAWQKLLEWIDEDRSAIELRPSIAPAQGRRFPLVAWRPLTLALAALLVVAGSITGWLIYRSRGASGATPDIRVAAFTVPLGDTVAGAFGQGFAADLARIVTSGGSKLHVVDGTGVGTGAAAAADFVLNGTVRSEAGKLRATLTLNLADDGSIIWSTNLERPIAEADAMHHEAEVRMGSVFICALDEAARDRSIVSIDALKVYLQACEALPNGDDMVAIKLLRDVTRLAPNFAQGWATLAEWNAFNMEEADDPTSSRKEALDAADRALALDPRNSSAWVARSMTKFAMSEWHSAQEDLDKALTLNADDPIGNYFYATHLWDVGRNNEALEYAKRAASSGPLFWPKTRLVIQLTADVDDLDGALSLLADARTTWPDEKSLMRTALDLATKYIEPAKAAAMLNDPALTDAVPPARLKLYSLEMAARTTPTPAVIAASGSAIDQYFNNNASLRAAHYITIGRIDDAYASLKNVSSPIYNAPYLPNLTPFFAPNAVKFRADPRFMPFARQQGLVAIWQTTNKWPDFCKAADTPYDCKVVAQRLK